MKHHDEMGEKIKMGMNQTMPKESLDSEELRACV